MHSIIKINLGAGHWRKDGWLNLNCRSPHYDGYGVEDFYKFTDVEYDLTSLEPMPFDDKSVDKFFSCMVFEHLEDRHIKYILGECYRCLKSSGSILICVPIPLHDIRQFIKRLNHINWGFNYNHNRNGRHINCFPSGKLRHMLENAGFTSIKKLRVSDIEQDFHSHVPLAQYVEGLKNN